MVGSSRLPGSWNNFRIVATKGENVVSNMAINMEGLSPCTHKDDTRLFIHAKDAASEGCKMSL